jgi:hypothetical protein
LSLNRGGAARDVAGRVGGVAGAGGLALKALLAREGGAGTVADGRGAAGTQA